MTGNHVALDTNAAIAILNQTSNVAEATGTPFEVILPVPVIGELRFGALTSTRSKENLARIESLISACRVLDVTQETTVVYAEIRAALKRSGRPIPENDIWIAALCVQHGLALSTADSHFEHIDGLRAIRPI